MGLPPPKLLDLNLFIQEKDSHKDENLEVWEIAVPPTNSLYWSIVLSYLLPSKSEDFLDALSKLTDSESKTTASCSRKRSSSSSIDYKVIYKRLRNFNPFKNRYVSFFDDKIIEVFRTFKLKLNQYANDSRSNVDEWNDEMKLNAATRMLNCKIDIFMPKEAGIRYVLYPKRDRKSLKSKITLFQYKDQKHGHRKENINVFYFAMSSEHAYNLKISALSFILKKAKLSVFEINYLKRLMKDPKAHGENFLRTVLQSPNCNLMIYFYKSPYIALKLSEADFETNPIATGSEHPSVFLLSFSKANTMYTRILYDFAANCRYLFERSIRDADETILDTLKLIHDIFDKDKDDVDSLDCDNFVKERTLRRRGEFSRFNEYQQKIVSKINELKHELELQSTGLVNLRKNVIECILSNYFKFFYYNSQNIANLQDIYYNYLTYSEYYENLDSFSSLSFFDNIHLLKKLFQIKEENIYENIESSFFLLVVSNKAFPKFNHSTKCNTQHDEMDCERKRSVLRLIPLLYREKLKSEILNFQSKLHNCVDSQVPPDKIKENNFRSSLASLPEIRDELLICRIRKYLSVAINVSFQEDGIKGIFVIERALQVLGESIKPQSTEGCIVSSMLGSQIPATLKKKLINIRDDLSHYKDNSVLGRMTTENDEKLFKDLQDELKKILEAFEIVAFTQYLRLEEYLLEKGQTEIETQLLDKNIIEKYLEEKQKRLHDRNTSYKKYYNQCIKLSLSIIIELKKYLHENHASKVRACNKSDINIIVLKLKSIEYVFLLMSKLIDKAYFQTFLTEIKSYREKYQRDTKKIETLRYDIESFRNKYIESITSNFHIENFSEEMLENTLCQYPKLESFLACLKKCCFDNNNVKDIIRIIQISYDEAVEAQKDLSNFIQFGPFDFTDKEELLIKKLIISPESLKKLRNYLKQKNMKLASKELGKKWITKECLVNKVKKLFEDNSIEDGDIKTLLIKIAYQSQLPKSIFTTAIFTEQICNHIKTILTRKVQFLLSRIQDIKAILIDEDDEIREAWKWGRSNGIKYHMKFLMRQRFLREMSVRASLEMAFFDCLNILKREQFKEMNEKLNNIFTGINLRNVISHGHGVLETVGGLLDEDDFPSELINKMLDLIADSEVITSMQRLIPCSGTLEKDSFISWIENNEDEAFSQPMKIIKSCPRWTCYLFLLPLI